MADTQSTVYAQAYGRNIMQLAQQKYSKLLDLCYKKPDVKGKVFYQDQIGEWSMSAKGGRNVQTPNNDPTLARRMCTMVDYHDARLLDRGDELRMLSDPRSAYTIAAASSLGRQIDSVIANAVVGTSYYGETGTSSITLGTDAISGISHISGTAGTMRVATIRAAKRILDLEDVEDSERFLVVTPYAIEQMLGITEATSSDYNNVKALVNGDINTFLGFKVIMSNQLPLASAGSTTTNCFAVQRYGICVAMSAEPMVRTDERNDLSYSWQIYYELNIGAVRLEEARAVLIPINTA
jgi:hypothetical protein